MGSYELLVWLIRTSGTVEHRPSAGHLCEAAPCCAAGRSATTAATDAEFARQGERDTPDQERRPTAQVAGPSAVPASEQRDQAVPEAGAVNDAAVAAYRLSAQAGNPLSERKLAQMFGRTSRRWARARIAEARRAPSSRLTGIRQSPSAPNPRSARRRDPQGCSAGAWLCRVRGAIWAAITRHGIVSLRGSSVTCSSAPPGCTHPRVLGAVAPYCCVNISPVGPAAGYAQDLRIGAYEVERLGRHLRPLPIAAHHTVWELRQAPADRVRLPGMRARLQT